MEPIWDGGLLRKHRERLNLTQREVADALCRLSEERYGQRVAVNEKMLSAWERGEKRPSRRYQRLLCEFYRATPEVLRLREGSPLSDPTCALDEIWTPGQAGVLLEAVAYGDVPLSPSIVPRLAHEWLVAEPPQVAEQRSGRRIGEDLVRRVQRRVEHLRLVDDFVGGRDLYELVARELRATIALVRDAAYTEALGRRLLSAIGELCQLAAWVAADAGLYAAAERYYVAGVHAAHAADDRPLAAHCISSLSYQVANVGDPRDAVLLARSAYEGARRSATATTRALLQERVAWAHARAGDARQTERALRAVEEEHAQRRPEDDPPWVYWLDRDEIDVMAGRCYTELRKPARAEPLLRAVLDRYGEERAREAALYTSWLAEDYVQLGEIDRAGTSATRALMLASRVNSARSGERVEHLRRRLAPYRSVATVREFEEQQISR